eukprot:3334477-Pleurochrysis_carterae.AAC.4
MSCGDNPKANMTMSITLLWVQTPRTPTLGEQIHPVASWQYQSADSTELEYIPESTDCPGHLSADKKPIPGLSASSLTTLVQEQLTALPGPLSEVRDELISLTPHNLGVLRFRNNPCKWKIVTADELLAPEELGKLVQILSCCPKARIIIIVACQSEPPVSPHWVKRDRPRDGAYRADSTSSPWYEGFPFMRWVDQFLLKPDAWATALPSIPILTYSEPCALFVWSYPSLGCVSCPTFCVLMEGHEASAVRPKEPDFDEHLAYLAQSPWCLIPGFNLPSRKSMSGLNRC